LEAVERFCDRVVLLENGTIFADGEPDLAIAQYRRNMEPAGKNKNSVYKIS
jgi:ABC-type polysaccharide/polyol phosphate transport system ATPase subunit